MLSAADLAGMTQTVNDSLVGVEHLVILRESAGAEDSWGHKGRSFPIETPIDGYVHQLRGDELAGPVIAGQVVATAEVRLPFGTAINERDKIRRADGSILEATYVRDPSGYGLLLEVGVFSVKPSVAGGS